VTELISTEWSVQYRTNAGGNFDRIHTVDSRHGKPYTEATARAQAEAFNKGKSKENQCRAASRPVGKWTVAGAAAKPTATSATT
jgi:hypothetical protein